MCAIVAARVWLSVFTCDCVSACVWLCISCVIMCLHACNCLPARVIVCLHACNCVSACVWLCVCMHAIVSACVFACLHVRNCESVPVWLCVCTCVIVYMHVIVSLHVCACVSACVWLRTCMKGHQSINLSVCFWCIMGKFSCQKGMDDLRMLAGSNSRSCNLWSTSSKAKTMWAWPVRNNVGVAIERNEGTALQRPLVGCQVGLEQNFVWRRLERITSQKLLMKRLRFVFKHLDLDWIWSSPDCAEQQKRLKELLPQDVMVGASSALQGLTCSSAAFPRAAACCLLLFLPVSQLHWLVGQVLHGCFLCDLSRWAKVLSPGGVSDDVKWANLGFKKFLSF